MFLSFLLLVRAQDGVGFFMNSGEGGVGVNAVVLPVRLGSPDEWPQPDVLVAFAKTDINIGNELTIAYNCDRHLLDMLPKGHPSSFSLTPFFFRFLLLRAHLFTFSLSPSHTLLD
jgi:hypothetical protein